MAALGDRTRFEPAEVEPRITRRWLESGLFHPEPEGTVAEDENFSIAIPPPNVTGALHMGHALNGSIQDTLTRLARMRGRRAKWVLGTDHAGIATQRQVEKLLATEGTSRDALGREPFVERVWQWREEYGGTIVEQFKRLGASCDYEDERFTLDPQYVRAVLQVFAALHDKGLIYRDNYMVNWDPGLRSAISDLEVDDVEVTDVLFSIAYPLVDGTGEVVVATVRPETMLADVAVAVHPEDERYAQLVGREVRLPLTDRTLPVIADAYVKTDFGTGCLKITPGHDPNDFEIGRRHGLPELGVIGEDGRMAGEHAGRFAGMDVEAARAAVVEALREAGALRAEEPYTHVVPFSNRSGARVEPLVSLQWFMRMDELAAPAIAAVEEGRIRIHPESQRRRYLDWLREIRPWCVSRQLWWGHRIPVWYRGEETHVGVEAPEGEGWVQDEDVLDTWFSSALWPFATLGWPDDTPELRAFYPTAVLSTARDILFLWVARMVMLGLEFAGDVPFRDVYVHSVIQAPDGRRMSKSLGTGIDPLEVIDQHGADGTRFGLLAMSSTQDVRFSEEKIAQGAALANKLFNATRFALGRVQDVEAAPRPTAIEDRWILSRLARATAATRQSLEAFDFSKAALGLYDYVYNDLCDWYLELIKGREVDEDLSATLRWVIQQTLALAHPVIPFVTEELWPHVGGEDLLAAAAYPEPADPDDAAEATIGDVIAAVTAVRSWRNAANVRPGAVLPARLDGFDGDAAALVLRLARLAPGEGTEEARIPVGAAAVLLLPTGDVDFGAVAARRDAERERLRGELVKVDAKLANTRFTDKAPPPVVEAERVKRMRLQAELEALG